MGNIQKAGAEVAQDLEARQCEEIWGAASSGVVHRNTRQRADIWAVEEDKGKGKKKQDNTIYLSPDIWNFLKPLIIVS